MRGLIHKQMQAKVGATKDAATTTTRGLRLPWVAAVRGPKSGHAQAWPATMREPS